MNNTLKALCIGIGSLALFLFAFFALQHYGIYQRTLGKISSNYERIGTWDNYTINQVKKPYIDITDDNILIWDADIYYAINKDLYLKDVGGYQKVRAAFFPLFPIIWRFTGLSPTMICFFNYILFALFLYLLIRTLVPNSAVQLPAYVFSLLMPSVIIYYIPYSEAVFMMSFTLAVMGMTKKRYSLYFVGMLLTATTRPATAFLLIAMIGIEVLAFIQHRNIKTFFVQCLKKFIPYLLGVFLVFLLYYINTGNWWELFRAQSYWDNTFTLPKSISDWSAEGFGLNVFTICFLVLPALVYLTWQFLRSFTAKKVFIDTDVFKGDTESIHYYLVQVSLLYFVGIFAYQIFFKAGGLHGLFRFIMASPLFYITLLYYMQHASGIALWKKLALFAGCSFALYLMLKNIEYGGDRFTFSYAGMYLGIFLFLLLALYDRLPRKLFYGILVIATILCITWHTYMFNIFLSYGWTFT